MPTPCNSSQNLVAYEGVEELTSFKSNNELDAYRNERIAFAAEAIAHISRHLDVSRKLTVVDIGSGSSCLLYALNKQGLLEKGTGVEISSSRHNFAQQWKHDESHFNVDNVLGNIEDTELDNGAYDLGTVIDNTFTYFQLVNPDLPNLVLKKIHTALKPGGTILLELSTYAEARRILNTMPKYQEWVELSESNAYKYALYSSAMTEDQPIIRVESRYLARHGQDKIKVEYSRLYTAEELEGMLCAAEFTIDGVYSSYTREPYVEGESSHLIINATKNG